MVEYIEVISGSFVTVNDTFECNEIKLPRLGMDKGKQLVMVLHRVEVEMETLGATDLDKIEIAFTMNEKSGAVPNIDEGDLICKFKKTVLGTTAAGLSVIENIMGWACSPRMMIDDNSIWLSVETDDGTKVSYRLLYTVRAVTNRELKLAFSHSRKV